MNKKFALGILVLIVLVVAGFGITKIFNSSSVTGNAIKEDTSNAPVKEFVMTSFYDNTGIWFSLKEINVNKGDIVRIKVTNIKGTHDFTLDEYDIKKITPSSLIIISRIKIDIKNIFYTKLSQF